MNFDDYEALPPSSSTATHMVAGAFGGICEHCIMYPIDTVKTRMQSLKPNPMVSYQGVFEGLAKMVRQEGLFRPVKGMSAIAFGAGPAHALYFSCYEKMKRVLSGTEHGAGHPLAQGAAGALSTILHDAIMNPAEVVKQRMQMYDSPYKSCMQCFRTILKSEGSRAFYRSYTTSLSMNIPFQSIHFMTYEYCQDITNHKRTYNPVAHMVSGAISGAFAAALTTPLDVCKTLLNTQEKGQISGLVNAIITVYKSSGPKGYFKGMQARVIHQMPSTAIAWTAYEFFKNTVLKYNGSSSFKGECIPFIAHASSIERDNIHQEECLEPPNYKFTV